MVNTEQEKNLIDDIVKNACGEDVRMMRDTDAKEIQRQLEANFKSDWKKVLVDCADNMDHMSRAWFILSGGMNLSRDERTVESDDLQIISGLLRKILKDTNTPVEDQPVEAIDGIIQSIWLKSRECSKEQVDKVIDNLDDVADMLWTKLSTDMLQLLGNDERIKNGRHNMNFVVFARKNIRLIK